MKKTYEQPRLRELGTLQKLTAQTFVKGGKSADGVHRTAVNSMIHHPR